MLFDLEYKTYAIERVSICGDSFVLYDSRSKCLFSSVIIVYWFKLPEGEGAINLERLCTPIVA